MVDFDGTVWLVWGRCPSINFMVRATQVTTDDGTDFKGGRCGDISQGTDVHVTGRTQPDGSVAADRVMIKKGHDDD